MQYAHPSCQLERPRVGDSSRISLLPSDPDSTTPASDTHTPNIEFERPNEYSGVRFSLVRGDCQEVHTTTSRRSGPRKWLRAVEWLIAAGLHRRVNATTRRVAEDLAARMDFDLGHVRYALDAMVARLGISKASIKRHVGYLRELGALVWVEHGTKTNIRRKLGLGGYAGTATVYGAVIPPVYDHAMGHILVGEGYNARIIVDDRPRTSAVPASRTPVDNPPVENPGTDGREPPSRSWVSKSGTLKQVGGCNYTPQAAREDESTTSESKANNNRSSNGTRRSPIQVAQDIRIAAQVRPLVRWTQYEGLRRLAFSLRPLIDRGMDSYGIAEYLHGLCSARTWRPRNPAAYISTALAAQQKAADEQAEAFARWEAENPLQGAFTASHAARMDVMAGLREGQARYEQQRRAHGWDDLNASTDSTWNAEADILAFLNGSPA